MVFAWLLVLHAEKFSRNSSPSKEYTSALRDSSALENNYERELKSHVLLTRGRTHQQSLLSTVRLKQIRLQVNNFFRLLKHKTQMSTCEKYRCLFVRVRALTILLSLFISALSCLPGRNNFSDPFALYTRWQSLRQIKVVVNKHINI